MTVAKRTAAYTPKPSTNSKARVTVSPPRTTASLRHLRLSLRDDYVRGYRAVTATAANSLDTFRPELRDGTRHSKYKRVLIDLSAVRAPTPVPERLRGFVLQSAKRNLWAS